MRRTAASTRRAMSRPAAGRARRYLPRLRCPCSSWTSSAAGVPLGVLGASCAAAPVPEAGPVPPCGERGTAPPRSGRNPPRDRRRTLGECAIGPRVRRCRRAPCLAGRRPACGLRQTTGAANGRRRARPVRREGPARDERAAGREHRGLSRRAALHPAAGELLDQWRACAQHPASSRRAARAIGPPSGSPRRSPVAGAAIFSARRRAERRPA